MADRATLAFVCAYTLVPIVKKMINASFLMVHLDYFERLRMAEGGRSAQHSRSPGLKKH